ncbi:hypothetical protein TA3x_003294 [Tundrisphaera sp. TA3]|uniref:hypothetical protein n=1 Tax=Tundrisphaera sp. TA3 TaxID=3435775 RepID=UPI003EBDCF12
MSNAIVFNITQGSDRTISLQSPLPAVTHRVAIDGQTQPGYSSAPVVVLNGANAGVGANGLTFLSGGNVVRGLTINGFRGADGTGGGNGIALLGPGSNTVQNCYIGTNFAATEAVPNRIGLMIQSPNNQIGGDDLRLRNFISGNTGAGAAAGAGILMQGAASGNRIEGNYIGLNFNGQTAIPNSYGVLVATTTPAGATVNTIGGPISEAGNFISGNTLDGIALNGSANTRVIGNYIGLNAAAEPAGNGGNGISSLSASAVATNIRIGGSTFGEGNLIWFNEGAGVRVATLAGGTVQGVTIQGNLITGNKRLGIDTGPAGVTPGYLFVTSATRDPGNLLTLSGVYHGTPNTTYSVDFYGSDAADPSGYGQGDLFFSTVTITTDVLGNATFSQPYSGITQTEFTATVTDAAGTTSEFSPAFPLVAAVASTDLVLALTGPATPVFSGTDFTLTATVTNNGTVAANGVVVDDLLPVGLAFISATTTAGTVGPDANGLIHANLGTIAAGASVTITLRVNALETGALTNAGAVFSTTFDPNYANNQATQTITIVPPVQPTSDLGIGQTSFAPFVGKVVGQNLVYTITVTNFGPNAATDVTVNDFVPANQQYVDASSSQGTSSFANGIVTTRLGTLQVGATATVTVLLRLTQAGTATNVVTVNGAQLDTNASNNSATLVDTITGVNATTPLSLTQSAGSNPIVVGQPQTITLTVTNPNTVPAPGVIVTNTIPANTTFVRASTSQGTFSLTGNNFAATIGTLPAGGSATVTLVLNPTSATPIVNNAATIASGVPGAVVTFSTQVIPVGGVSTGPTVLGIGAPGTGKNLNRLTVGFSTPLNRNTAIRKANYRVFALGAAGTTSRAVAVRSVAYNATTRSVTITLANSVPRAQLFRLVVVGANANGIRDLAGNRLNGSGTAGSNYTTTFLGTSLANV